MIKRILLMILIFVLILSNIAIVDTQATIVTNSNYVFNNSNNTITKYIGSDSIVYIPEKIINVNVDTIGTLAFSENKLVESVILHERIKEIERFAFFYCESLVDIYMPDSMTSIGNFAFENCFSLKEIYIPDNVHFIGNRAFSSCRKLKDITVGEYNTEYKDIDGVLYSKDGKTLIQYTIGREENSFYIPNDVKEIGSFSFDESIIERIVIPDNVEKIGDQAFLKSYNLHTVRIPTSVTEIGIGAFARCSKITLEVIDNSYALTYAIENDIEYKIVEETIRVESVKMSEDEIYMDYSSNNLDIEYSITPEDAENKNVSFESSDTSVAIVDNNGMITYKGDGECTIVITTEDGGFTDSLQLVVDSMNHVKDISINNNVIHFTGLGESINLIYSITPSDADNTTVTFNSSNISVAAINSNGSITSMANGETIITVKTVDGNYTDSIKVQVCEVIKVEKIVIDEDEIYLKVLGETANISYIILPSEVINKSVTYRSDNTDVAIVDENGMITSVGEGTCMVYVKTESGVSDSILVKCDNIIYVTGVTIESKEIEFNSINEKMKLSYTVIPDNAQDKKVTYTSSDDSVVSISSNGMMIAVGVGECTITVKTDEGEFEKSITVIVNLSISFDNIIIEESVRDYLNNNDEKITMKDLEEIESLNLQDLEIEDIGDLEYLINLKELDLSENSIKDFGVLKELKYLEKVVLTDSTKEKTIKTRIAKYLEAKGVQVINVEDEINTEIVLEEKEDIKEEIPNDFNYMYVLIVAAAIILLTGVVIVVVKKKK